MHLRRRSLENVRFAMSLHQAPNIENTQTDGLAVQDAECGSDEPILGVTGTQSLKLDTTLEDR
jgi:hypothetical protein